MTVAECMDERTGRVRNARCLDLAQSAHVPMPQPCRMQLDGQVTLLTLHVALLRHARGNERVGEGVKGTWGRGGGTVDGHATRSARQPRAHACPQQLRKPLMQSRQPGAVGHHKVHCHRMKARHCHVAWRC